MDPADVDDLIPEIFTCPLTLDVFSDPVVAIHGHTYSRAAIELHFALRQTSPLTNERLDSTQLLPNHTLRKAIEEWRGKQPLPIDPRRIHVTEEVLGLGSFGRVVTATLNIGGGRVIRVAVKSMPDMTVAEEREAFQRELKAHIHAVRHCDGICKLYGTYEWGHRLSLVMKMYEGGSLDKKIRDGPLDADKICRYAHALCSALRQIHGCGLVVRDIKPANILFDSFDQPVLADFGIAEVVSTATRRLPTSIKGTFNYMAPETFLDAEAGGPGIGPPADVWAMACVVVEMHTRKVPWEGMNMQQIVRAVSVDYRAPAVPETAHAHALLGRCFLRNPEHRPYAGDLADAFAPPSGARDLIPQLCEEMDRLNASKTMLEATLKAAEALLGEERLEREKLAREKTDLEAQLALLKLEKRQEEALRAAAEAKVAAAEVKVAAAEGTVAVVGSAGIFECQSTMTGHSGAVYQVEFADDGAMLVSGGTDGTSYWDVQSGEAKSVVEGSKFAFSKGSSGEHKVGKFLITAEGDILRIFRSEGGVTDKADKDTVPVAFFRAPAPIFTVDTSGAHIAVGCHNGEVLRLRAAFLLTG